MKKLIITAMVACAAIFANAATVDWSYYDETDVGDGYTFYVINNAGVADSLVTLLATDGNIDGFKSAISGYGSNVSSFTSAFSTDGYAYADGSFSTANDYLTIIAVKDLVADATFYYTADTSTSGYTYEPPSSGIQLMFDSSSLTAGTIATASVPEPTSGLLMLVGLAGLALRRRRA